MLPSRKKRFSHKVRTGCLTCRRRRVKCGEQKPECHRCLKAGYACLGYSQENLQVVFHDYVPITADQRSYKTSQCDPAHGKALETDLFNNISTLSIVFRDPKDLRAFHSFVNRTGPLLASYGPHLDMMFSQTIPQIALQSPAVTNMVLSLSETHDKAARTWNCQAVVTSRATMYYNKAIHDIVIGKTPLPCTLLTAFLAWCAEMMEENFQSAQIHMNGMRSVLNMIKSQEKSDPDSTIDVPVQDLETVVEMADGCLALSTHDSLARDKSKILDLRIRTLKIAREVLVQHVDAYLDSPKQAEDVYEYRAAITLLILKFRRWDSVTSPSNLYDAMRLLLILAMGLLPPSEAHGYSHSLHSSMVDYLLQKTEGIVRTIDKNHRSAAAVTEILKTLLRYILRCWEETDRREKAATMLSKLSMQSPWIQRNHEISESQSTT